MEQYQRDQQQLQQYYQQQRIMELQAAQQRQREMQFQNVTRFQQMQDRALAAVAPLGGYVPSELGFGRNIGLTNSAGVARQSMLGTVADARFSGGGMFFRTAGFQLNMSEAAVRDRAQQTLGVFGSQMFNVGADAITPMFLQRSLGRVGLGSIQERSLGIADAFAGLRGTGANQASGRGIGLRDAAAITERLTRNLNESFNGMLDEEQIGTLTTAATSALTSRQISSAGAAGVEGTAALLTKMTEQLAQVARNTGMSAEQTGQLVRESRSMGNSFDDVTAISRIVGENPTTTTANRERQLRMGLGFTAQGRQMGVMDARGFGIGQLQAANDLVDAFNTGGVSRADLFRFGGEDSLDAAQRVVNRRLQAGQQFAQDQTGTLGVLGAGGMASLGRGTMGFMSDVASAFAANPFAALEASVNMGTQQRLIEQAGPAALRMAENDADLMGNLSPSQRRAMVIRGFGRRTGRSNADAVREVGLLRGMETTARAAVERFAGFTTDGSIDQEAMVSALMSGRETFRNAGISAEQTLSDEFLGILDDNPDMDSAGIARKFNLRASAADQRKSERRALLDNKKFLKSMGINPNLGGFGEHRRNTIAPLLDEAFNTGNVMDVIASQDLLTESMLRTIMDQDMSDGTQDFMSTTEINEMMKTEEGRAKVAAGVSDEGRRELLRVATRAILDQQTRTNQENVELGSSPLRPVYVRDAGSPY